MHERRLHWAAGYLAVVQFLFFTAWIVYSVYVGNLLDQVGIGKDKQAWFNLLDQALFTIMGILMGFAADHVRRMMWQLGPFILGVNTLSCLGFIAMPLLAEIRDMGMLGQAIWVSTLVLWVATSSVLNAPAFVLVTQHAARSQVPVLVTLSLTGLALGGAIAPYLGLVLKTLDPLIPFLVTAVTLWLATVGLIYMERHLAKGGEPAKPIPAQPLANTMADWRLLLGLMAAALLLALGFQIHSSINSGPQYLRFVQPGELVFLMPIFWIGYNLLMFPGSKLSERHNPLRIMVFAIFIGIAALWLAASNFGLVPLIIAQLLSGGIWGVLSIAGTSASLQIGGKNHGGLVLGAWSSMLALGALAQVLIVMENLPKQVDFSRWLNTLPMIFWAFAGIFLYFAQKRFQHMGRD